MKKHLNSTDLPILIIISRLNRLLIPLTRSAILLLLFIVIVSCEEQKAVISAPSEAEEQEIRDIGQLAASRLLQSLQKELLAAIEAKGTVSAVAVCNHRASILSDAIERESKRLVDLKRTSFRYRNPNNAPDWIDRDILVYFHNQEIEQNNLSKDHIIKISGQSGTFFRYYKPLKTKPLCLNCHGPTQNMEQNVRYMLRRLYPADKAINYSKNQFRGVVCVTIR
jgi:hypothetical protein